MTDDHELAATVAREAGRLLVALRTELAGAAPDRLGAEGDRRSHVFVTGAIAAAHPEDAILSEEAVADPGRLSARRVWVIDPIDGTREFTEPGRLDWAVHVALVVNGALAAGAVALPALRRTLATRPAPALAPRRPGPIRIVVSRTRPPVVADALRRAFGARIIPMGSAGAKAMAVVAGTADIYVHAGGQYEWDSAAPAAVSRAAGLHVSRLDGSPLVYNQPDPWLPDLLVCRAELAERAFAALARAPGWEAGGAETRWPPAPLGGINGAGEPERGGQCSRAEDKRG